MDALPPTAFSETTRKARKAHKCCDCDTTIQPGDQYVISSGIWDGEPDSYKHYMNCHEIFKAASESAEYVEEGPAFQGLWEWLTNELHYTYTGKNLESLTQLSNKIGIPAETLNSYLKLDLTP